MRVHIIVGGVITNTVEVLSIEKAQSLFPDATVMDASLGGSIGDTVSGDVITPGAPPSIPIQEQIDQLEKTSMLNRGSRELELRLMEKEAVAIADDTGHTVEEVLASVIYYVKLKALDNQITALRGQL